MVGDVRSDAINSTVIVSIGTVNDFRLFHSRLEHLKNLSKCFMKYLLLKLVEADVIGVTFRSYRQVNVETDTIESPYLLE